MQETTGVAIGREKGCRGGCHRTRRVQWDRDGAKQGAVGQGVGCNGAGWEQ